MIPPAERRVRELFRKVEGANRAPAWLYAAPGVAWWLFLLSVVGTGGVVEPTARLIGMMAAIPILILTCVAVVFGLLSLALLQVTIGPRLVVCAINLSGPLFLFAGW